MKETYKTMRIYDRLEVEKLFKSNKVVYITFDRHSYELKVEVEN